MGRVIHVAFQAGCLTLNGNVAATFRYWDNNPKSFMETENVRFNIPSALLVEAQRAASTQHVPMDELMQEAVKRYLDDLSWKWVFAYGQQQSRKLGIKEEDVERIVHEFREEERQRQSNPNAGH